MDCTLCGVTADSLSCGACNARAVSERPVRLRQGVYSADRLRACVQRSLHTGKRSIHVAGVGQRPITERVTTTTIFNDAKRVKTAVAIGLSQCLGAAIKAVCAYGRGGPAVSPGECKHTVRSRSAGALQALL
jgi:hypothetical protein